MTTASIVGRLLVAAAVTLASLSAQAQNWPAQPIRIIVPFTPGTGMDMIARTISPELSRRLGQPVVVQNTPGASGNIGADMAAKAPADGYTILMGANTMLIASQLYQKVPFDPVKDFSSVSMAAWGTLMLVANPKTGLRSMPDLVARAKARPGQINFGSPGIGTPHHMAMELFKAQPRPACSCCTCRTRARLAMCRTCCPAKSTSASCRCTSRRASSAAAG